MERLIDIDVLFDYFGNDAIDKTTRSNIEYFVSEKGTVKAIPKADYENRLKADLKAILDKLRAEIEDLTYYWCEVHPRSVIDDALAIIDKYKAEMESEE